MASIFPPDIPVSRIIRGGIVSIAAGLLVVGGAILAAVYAPRIIPFFSGWGA